jgi:hypothetical protein
MKSARAVMCLAGLLIFAAGVRPVCAQTAPSGGSDPQAIWNALAHPAFDPQKVASVSNLVITRDRIRVVLDSGTLHFTQPVNGIVFGAVFSGQGHLQMSPPNPQEAQQLQLLTKQNDLNLPFSEAAFSFTDKTFDEIAAKVKWGGASGANDDLLASRIQTNEDLGAEMLPRLFKSVMGADRSKSALFLADIKTSEHGWIQVKSDTSEPEEISIGRWVEVGGGKLFDTWMSFPAGGRSSSDAYNVPFEKADYVIQSYDMDVAVTGGADLNATAKVSLETRWAGERVLLFSLDSNARVDKVTNAQGAALTFFQAREQKDRNQSYGDYVAVVFPSPLEAGQAQVLTLHYGGKRIVRQVGPGNYFAQSYGWYPARLFSHPGDDFAGRYDYHVRFRCPKRFILIATGNKVGENIEGNDRISEWKSDIPLAVAGFAFGDYKLVTAKVGDIEVQVFANIEPDDTMQQIERMANRDDSQVALGRLSATGMAPTIANEMANSIRTFQEYFGPYPYKKLAVTNIPFGYGQGWPGLIYLSILTFLDSTQRHELGIPPGARDTEFFRAHETSHQWWGHRVSWKSYHDQWMSEGFAQFSGNLYSQIRDGQKEYLDRLREDKLELVTKDERNHVFDSVGPAWMGYRTQSSQSLRAPQVIIYNKGGYAVTMLRMMMSDPRNQDPDARFKAMMRDFCKTFDNKAASTEDFKAIAEKYMTQAMDLGGNHKLDWFFNQYVYGTGIPHYEFHYEVKDAGNGQWNVTGNIKRSGVPEPWLDAVPFFMDRNGKMTRIGLINAMKSDTQFSFTLPQNPGKLQINSNEELLAEIKQ